MNTVSFPEFGWTFTMDPVAFRLFGLEIKWYGIIITIGILLAFLYFYYKATTVEQINPDYIFTVTLLTVPIGIIGARFIYVITNLRYFSENPKMILDIRGGGLAIYGGIIFGGATVIIYCLLKKIPMWKLLDAAAPGVMIGQLVGRWGNFINAEAYGYSENIDKLPWRMQIGDTCYHPTFLYESLWNLIGFLLIHFLFYRKGKKKPDGFIFLFYIGWYGFGRAWIEVLRTDSLYIGPLKFSVVVGILSVLASVIGIFLIYRRKKKA